MFGIIEIIVLIIVLIFSIIFHEVAHGMAAYALGDSTAKEHGRLSLNPIRHIDFFGSILLPGTLILINVISGINGFVIGWAKPVPINPLNFRDRKWGNAKVSIAGPAANILLALIFGLALRFFILGIGNLPEQVAMVFVYIVQINLTLAIFNLIPIPPLDGSHILFALFPRISNEIKISLMRYGMFILLAVIFFAGDYISYASSFLFRLITGV